MCEYCGCQSIAAIGDLTREHDAVVDLIGEVRSAHRAGEVQAMVAGARRIAQLLGPHTAVEEAGLFPAMAADYPDQIADLSAEHRRIEAVLAQVAASADGTAPSAPEWTQRLMDALDVLRHHILKEQDGVFPAALAELSTAQWEAIDEIRARVGSALPHAGL